MNLLLKKARRARNLANKYLVQFQNEYVRRERVFGHPFQVTLESGNVCNLKCPLCPTTFREKRLPTGILKYDNAVKIIDQFPYAVFLILSNWGEPFLNKDIFRIISYAKSKDIEVRMESNFTLFDEDKCRKLVESKLDHLIVALDGVSQEAYEKYRVGGKVADVLKNVRALRRVQDEMNDTSMEMVWKMVINKYNVHEVDQARAMAEELGMTFEAVTIWTPEDRKDEWLPEATVEEKESWRNLVGGPPKCHHLWQDVSVNFNGDLHPCCAEFAPSDRLVNVLEKPFAAIWNGEGYRSRRRINKGGPVDCSTCHQDRDTNWFKTWAATYTGETDRASKSPVSPRSAGEVGPN